MTTRTDYHHGTPCWIDLSSPDIDGSKAFYSGLFGWDTKDETDPEGNYIYTDFSIDGKSVAGLGPQQEGMAGMPPIWNSYVAVDDANQIMKAVEAAGGTVIMPTMEVTEAGSMAVFADPAGAVICVWQAAQHIGAQVVNEPNTYCWNELMSRDLGASKAFYSEVFGWEYDEMDMGEGFIYTVIKGGEEGGLGGLMPMPDEIPAEVPSYWGVYFTVDDADATAARAEELGGGLMMPAMDSPVGRMVTLRDPQGGTFTAMQPAPQE